MNFLPTTIFKLRALIRITGLIVCFLFFSFSGQDDKDRLHISVKHEDFTVDHLGNIYLINADEILKYQPSGKFFARYSNLKLGNITSVDVTNPLKIVLFYRDFQQIVFLDNQLTPTMSPISLEDLNHEQTEVVCASANNSLWIFDKQNNELTRFNKELKKVTATGNLKQVLQTDIEPNFMVEYNNYLFLNCPETGIFVFDIFGTFNKIISLQHLKRFKVNEDILYYRKDSNVCSYNVRYFEQACKLIPGWRNVSNVEYNMGRLYLGYKDSLNAQGL